MPSYQVKQSSTAYPLVFLLVGSADHVTGLTGATPTVTLSKSGGSFASPAGAVSEIANGWYKVAGNATDSGTLGPLLLHATAASADPTDVLYEVVAHDVQDAVHLGLSALPNTACTTNASLLTSGAGTDQLSVSSGKVLLQATQAGVTIPTVTTVTGQLTAAQVATGLWQDTTAGDFTVAGSIGKSLFTSGNAPGAASGLALVGSNVGSATGVTGAVGSVTGAVGSVTGAVGSVAGNVAGNVTGSVGSVVAAVTLTAGDSPVARAGTAQAGAASSITLDAGASATTNAYAGCLVKVTGGTGSAAGQCRTVTAYNGTTKVATVDYAWEVNPDVTSVFAVLYADGAALNASLQVAASSVQGNVTGSVASVTGAAGSVTGAVGSVTGAVGSVTAGVTVATNNDKAGYSLAVAPPTSAQVATAIWQDLLASADFATASSIGALLKADVNAPIGSIPTNPYTGTPPTAAAIAAAVLTDTTAPDLATSGSLGYVVTHQLGGAFTTAASSVFTAAALANAPGGGAAVTVGGYAAGQDPATLVLDAAASAHDTAGTIGQKVNAAGAAADPLLNAVPGAYASGTAGAALGKIGAGQITTVSPVAAGGQLSLVQGDSYFAADGRALSWTDASAAWPDLTGAAVTLTFYRPGGPVLLAVAGTVVNPSGANKQVRAELSAAGTAGLSTCGYAVAATLADGNRATLVRSSASVATQ